MSGEDVDIVAVAQARLGTVLRGKYRLDRILGIGGMATVYAATHRNGSEFAVKVLHPDLCLRSELRTRFLREGHAASAVKHTGAVAVLDDDVSEDGSAFLVMELLRGESVESLWERRQQRLPLRLVVGIGIQVLDVLTAAHARGVVHRDIKPANLFLTQGGQVKVLDFGIARLRDVAAGQATQTGMMMGTPAFMAPEQALARTADIDAQTDVWAVAATMFTLASGRLVHEAENAQQIMILAATTRAAAFASVLPEAPSVLGEIIDRGLHFEKAGRWAGADAMRDALRAATRALFGVAPTSETIAEILSDLGEEATVIQASPLRPLVPTPSDEELTTQRAQPSRPVLEPSPLAPALPFRGAPIAELATAKPVSVSPQRARVADARRRVVVIAAAVTVPIVLVPVLFLAWRSPPQATSMPASSALAAAASATSSATFDASPTLAPSASASVASEPPIAPVEALPSAAPTAASPRKAPSPAPAKDCTPYYNDKHIKIHPCAAR
jgi:serine/threonine-protein kinase